MGLENFGSSSFDLSLDLYDFEGLKRELLTLIYSFTLLFNLSFLAFLH